MNEHPVDVLAKAMAERPVSRRRVLVGGGVAALIAACGFPHSVSAADVPPSSSLAAQLFPGAPAQSVDCQRCTVSVSAPPARITCGPCSPPWGGTPPPAGLIAAAAADRDIKSLAAYASSRGLFPTGSEQVRYLSDAGSAAPADASISIPLTSSAGQVATLTFLRSSLKTSYSILVIFTGNTAAPTQALTVSPTGTIITTNPWSS